MDDATLIRLVGEKVMGFTIKPTVQGESWIDETGLVRGNVALMEWNPLANDSHSCAVLDKMAADGWCYNLSYETVGATSCVANFWNRDGVDVDGYSGDRKRAIVIAALKAHGTPTAR